MHTNFKVLGDVADTKFLMVGVKGIKMKVGIRLEHVIYLHTYINLNIFGDAKSEPAFIPIFKC